jgi:hypothetical protein
MNRGEKSKLLGVEYFKVQMRRSYKRLLTSGNYEILGIFMQYVQSCYSFSTVYSWSLFA